MPRPFQAYEPGHVGLKSPPSLTGVRRLGYVLWPTLRCLLCPVMRLPSSRSSAINIIVADCRGSGPGGS